MNENGQQCIGTINKNLSVVWEKQLYDSELESVRKLREEGYIWNELADNIWIGERDAIEVLAHYNYLFPNFKHGPNDQMILYGKKLLNILDMPEGLNYVLLTSGKTVGKAVKENRAILEEYTKEEPRPFGSCIKAYDLFPF